MLVNVHEIQEEQMVKYYNEKGNLSSKMSTFPAIIPKEPWLRERGAAIANSCCKYYPRLLMIFNKVSTVSHPKREFTW
jgi:hypothetical protein